MTPTITNYNDNESMFDRLVREYEERNEKVADIYYIANDSNELIHDVKTVGESINAISDGIIGVKLKNNIADIILDNPGGHTPHVGNTSTARNISNFSYKAAAGATVAGAGLNAANVGIKGWEAVTGKDMRGNDISMPGRVKSGAGAIKSTFDTVESAKDIKTYKQMYDYVKADGRHTWKSAARKFKPNKTLTMTSKVAKGFGAAQAIIAGVDLIFDNFLDPYWGIKNPINEWLRKPFSGDWDEMNAAVDKWKVIAGELSEVREYYRQMFDDVNATDSGWKGSAANAFVYSRSRYDDPLYDFIDACDKVGAGTIAAGELAEECFDAVFGGVYCILNIAVEIGSDALVPGIGWGKFLLKVVPLAMDAITSTIDIIEALTDYFTAVQNYAQAIAESQNVILEIRSI